MSNLDLREILFEIKQKFLREIPHPKLILKQIRILERKGEISPAFDENNQLDAVNREFELVAFLEKHIQKELQLKYEVSRSETYLQLRNTLVELYQNQYQLFKKLQSYLPQKETYLDEDVKMSDPFDVYEILKSIKRLDLKESEIKAYICVELDTETKNFTTVITTILRANKIIAHG